MTNSELISFYENLDQLTSFTRIRTVYDLTNNLDIYLLRFLRRDFFHYHFTKARKELEKAQDIDETDIEFVFGTIMNDDSYIYNYEDTIDLFSQYFYPTYIDPITEKINIFFPELDELSRIAFNKLGSKSNSPDSDIEDMQEEFVDNENISIMRKIIYLERLGVIDFLRKKQPFTKSVNSIANLLGIIINAKPKSIQPLLNAMINDPDSRHNPLQSQKNVSAVENYLTQIGYNIKI